MSESRQIQDMDAEQVAERHLIERYLSGHLSEADADAFETYVASHPEIVTEIERLARMKTGLEVLRRRGDLARLLGERPRGWYRSPWVAAAAAASLVVGGFLIARKTDPLPGLSASLAALTAASASPLALKTYTLTTERAAGAGAQIDVPPVGVAIALRFDTAAPGESFAIEALRAEGDTLQSVARTGPVASAADGSVVVYATAELLRPGQYLFRLRPASGEAPLEFLASVVERQQPAPR